jgi:GTP-binding protein
MSARVPQIAIVGRQNVGKSTLVNRLFGKRAAIAHDQPGVTRDRIELEATWRGRRFGLVDTAGYLHKATGVEALAGAQAERSIGAADLVVLVVDVHAGITEEDGALARRLRTIATPVLVVANKADGPGDDADVTALYRLGLGEPFAVSALHGQGIGDLMDRLLELLPDAPGAIEPVLEPRFAIVGRPNVGKSTLFNQLVGDERSVVHDMPGTTRDTVDTIVESEDGTLRFVDTAGMRRRSRVDEPTEYYSVLRALDAVDVADAALLVIDATEGVSHQDQRLAERIDGAGTVIVLVLNKWDLVATEDREQILIDVADRMGFLGYAPILKVSALTGRNLKNVLPALREAEAAYHVRIPTAELNRVVRDAQQRHPPPLDKRHRPRIMYATQGAADPPTFTLFATRTLPATYLRYIERMIREHFDLGPTPIKIRVRRRGE